MSVTYEIEAMSKTERRVKITVPVDMVKPRVDAAFRAFGQRAKVKGFRPGKVPASLIERMYGAALRAEVAEKLVADTADEPLAATGLRPASQPKLNTGPVSRTDPFEYSFEFEVFYEPESLVIDTFTLPPAPNEVSQDDITAEIDSLRQKHAERVPVEDRAADLGDQVTFDIVTVDGVEPPPGPDTRDVVVTLGSTDDAALTDALVGTRAGDVREVTLPGESSEGEIAHANVATVHIKAVYHLEVPLADDDFAQDLGYDGMQALRDDLVTKIATKRADDYRGACESDVFEQLLERNPLPVPFTPLVDLAYTLARQFGIDQPSRQILGMMLPLAERQYQEHLLTKFVAKQLEISPSPDDLLAAMAEASGGDPEAAQQMLDSNEAEHRDAVENLSSRWVRKEVYRRLMAQARVRTAEEQTALEQERAAKSQQKQAAAIAPAHVHGPHCNHDHDHDHDHDHVPGDVQNLAPEDQSAESLAQGAIAQGTLADPEVSK